MMSTEPKEADTPFSLSATLQNMELAEIPVSFNHTGVCIAFVVYSLAGMRLLWMTPWKAKLLLHRV